MTHRILRHRDRGFTLTEALATVAIVIILCALAMLPLGKMRRDVRQTELDSRAELIFAAAQNRLTQLRAAGRTELYNTNGASPLNAKPVDSEPGRYKDEDLYYILSADREGLAENGADPCAAAAILPRDQVDEELWLGNWVIEYDPQGGSVYAVFFSEEPISYAPGSDAFESLRYREIRLKNGARLGYYGGDSVGSAVTGSLDPRIRVINGEKLLLEIQCDMQGGFPLRFFVTLTDEEGHSTGEIELTAAHGEVDRNYRTYTATMEIDSVDRVHDNDRMRLCNQTRFAMLTPGSDLTVKVRIVSQSSLIDQYQETLKGTYNSLFAQVEGSGEDRTAVISCARHLQNLDERSGVGDRVAYARQENDIDFSAAAADSWDGYYPGQTFEPINNAFLREYDSSVSIGSDALHPVIYDLTIQDEDTATGLFGAVEQDLALKNIRLSGAKIQGQGDVGGLVGHLGGGSLSIENCQVYLSAARGDTTGGRDENDLWLEGSTVGGLVGRALRDVTIVRSFASTVLSGSQCAGGLVGAFDQSRELSIRECYADSYVYSERQAAGLLGSCIGTGNVTLYNSYAAGFLRGDITAGLVGGELNGGDTVDTVYSACTVLDEDGQLTYSTAKPWVQGGPTLRNVYYFEQAEQDVSGTQRADYTAWSGVNRASAVREHLSEAFAADTSDTYPYNLIAGMGLTTYSYPKLADLPHYGDWKAHFESGSLVYYEKYALTGGNAREYAFRGANVSNLSNSAPVLGDGYGMVYEGTAPETVELQDEAGRIYTLYRENAVEIRDKDKLYYLIPLPQSLSNLTDASRFYRRLTADGRSYYYNPHFANTPIESAQTPDFNGQVDVRTARQLYNLSLHYGEYRNILPGRTTYLQGRDIDYTGYDWALFGPGGAAVDTQAPIGTGRADAFINTYDGARHIITGISFLAGRDGSYTGFVGYNSGTLRNIVLTTDVPYLTDESGKLLSALPTAAVSGVIQRRTVYAGVLAGRNSTGGSIANCAVSGYVLQNYTYSGSMLYMGGLVGYNEGTIRGSSAVTPEITATSTYAQLRLGGFAGANNGGSIRQSYALAAIDVPEIRGGTTILAGFTAANSGTVRGSYCAVALSSAGGKTYGFSSGGGSVTGCSYLNGGTYSFAGTIHLYDYESGAPGASGLSSEELSQLRLQSFSSVDEDHTFFYPNTPVDEGTEAAYPYPSSVTGLGGAPVHYGDWVTEADLGTMGVVYWEYEEGGANGGFHFSFQGFEQAEKKLGSSLCTAHDDGGAVTRYGYGYYWKSSQVEPVLRTLVSAGEFQLGDPVSDIIRELEKQVPGFSFRAYETGTEEGSLRLLSGSAANGVWVLTQGTITHGFALSPFFAESYTYIQGTDDAALLAAADALGTKDGEIGYQVRSLAQLQFINWSVTGGKGSVSADVTDKNYYNYPYLLYTSSTGQAKQTLADALNNTLGGSRRLRTWEQSHDLNGTGADETDWQQNASFYPIAGGVAYSNVANNWSDAYDMVLYNWFGGRYDGQNYYIKNINIDSYCYNVGLFGATAGADIWNLVLYSDNNAVIQRNTGPTSNAFPDDPRQYQTAYALGGLIGLAYDYNTPQGNTIQNCAIAGYRVQDNSRNKLRLGEAAVGGLIGVSTADLRSCSAVVDIQVNCTHRWAAAATATGGSTTGALNAPSWGNFVRVGGLVGGLRDTATDCYTGGAITVSDQTLEERIKYGDSTNTQFIGLDSTYTGHAKSSGDNRNGSSPATYVYVAGVAGSGFSSNFKNFTGVNNSSSDGTPKLVNCYTYIDLPDMEGTISGISIIGSAADRFNYARAYVTNCYYLKSTRDGVSFANAFRGRDNNRTSLYDWFNGQNAAARQQEMLNGQMKSYSASCFWGNNNNTLNMNGLTQLTYDQMASRQGGANITRTNTSAADTTVYGNFKDALRGSFGWVSITEGDATIHGKYSFPGEVAELQGQDYPFPTVLTQTDTFGDTVNLHYGEWPTVGLFWKEGIVTVDLVADYQPADKLSYIDLTLDLRNVSAAQLEAVKDILPTFECINEGEEGVDIIRPTASFTDQPGVYTVRLEGVNEGGTEIIATLGDDTARLMATVTAQITASADPYMAELYLGDEPVPVRLTARDKNGNAIQGVTWEVINPDPALLEIGGPTFVLPDPADTEDKNIGNDADITLRGLTEGENTIQITAVCQLGDRKFEQLLLVPVTVYQQSRLGLANTAGEAGAQYMEGTVARDLTGWAEDKAPAWNPYPADETTGETTAPRCESTLFLYSRGNQASLENFTVARVRVLEGTAEYTLMEDGEIRDLTHYGAFFGETAAEGSDRILPITLRGKHARTVDLEITLRSEKGDFTLTVPVTLTQADTQVTAAFTTLTGQSLGEPQTLTYGEIPVLPLLSAETLEAMQADLPADNIYLDLTTPQGWSPSAAEPVYADTVYLPAYGPAGHILTFRSQGNVVRAELVPTGQSFALPYLEREGYGLAAWVTGTRTYAPGEILAPVEDMELTALWRKKVKLTIGYTYYDNYNYQYRDFEIYPRDDDLDFTDYDPQTGATVTFTYQMSLNNNDMYVKIDGVKVDYTKTSTTTRVDGKLTYRYTFTIPGTAFPGDTF